MANYADYIQFPDTMINGNYVERYAFPDSTGMYTDSTAWYRTPEGYKVVDRTDAKLYKLDHPEGRPYVAQTYSEDERQKLFNDAFGKSKIEDVEQKSDGGILSQAPKELVELVQAAMSDESAAQKLSLLMSQRPDLTDMVEQIAAELQGAQAMKCGGRVKKKALGSKLLKTQKAKCGCELKKVGGRLIEVDSCTGLPIHRNGAAIKKYEKTPGPITYALQAIEGSNTVENNLTAAISDSFKTGLAPRLYSSGQVGAGKQVLSDGSTSSVVTYVNGVARPVYEGLDELGNGTGKPYHSPYFIRLDDGSYVYKDPDTGNLYYNNGRYYDVKTGKTGNYDMFSSFNQTPNNINMLRAAGFVMGPLSTKVLTPATDGDELGTPKTTWRDTFGAGKSGKFGGLTYDQALARQQEMLNADWFNAQLGSNGLTKRGDDGMWGATSQKEYARYLAEKQRREEQAAVAQRADDQLRQQKFVEEIALSHPLEKAAIIPPKTPAIVKPQGLLPTAELIKANTLTAMLGQNISDRRMAKYGKAYDFIKTGVNSANMSAADTRRANRLATKMHKAGLMKNGGQLNYANYLN